MKAFRFRAVIEKSIENEIEIDSIIKVRKFVSVILESFGLNTADGFYRVLTIKKGKIWDANSLLDSALFEDSLESLKFRARKKLLLQLCEDSDKGIELQYLGKCEISKPGVKIVSTVGSLNQKQISELTGKKKVTAKTDSPKKNTKKNTLKKTSKTATKPKEYAKTSTPIKAKKRLEKKSIIDSPEFDDAELPDDLSDEQSIIDKILSSRLQSKTVQEPENDTERNTNFDIYDDPVDYYDDEIDDDEFEKNIDKTEVRSVEYLDEDEDNDDIFDDDECSDNVEDEFDDDDYFDNRDDFSDFYYDDNDDDDEKYY